MKRASLAERTKKLDAKLAEWLRSANRDKKLKIKDTEIAAEQFMGLLLSFAFWPKLMGIKKRIHRKTESEYVTQTVRMFLKNYSP